MKPNPWLTKIVLVMTLVALSGLPAMAQAASATPQNSAQQPPADSTQQPTGRVDPAAGPKTPVPSADYPDAPSASAPQQSAPSEQQSSSAAQPDHPQPQTVQEPEGTAAAERGRTAGGAGSKPAGMAIAPAKQKQTRSLLIKLGAVAAAGLAFGTVYALTRATPAVPPGSGTATNH